MEAAQAELGAAIEPVTTAWTRMKAGGLQWLVDTGLPALKSGFGWVLDNIPFVAALIGTLTTAWLVFGGAQKVTAAVTAVLTAAQTALNVVLNANPIGLVILAVTALVAAFLYLWNNCEAFREFWLNLWDKIKEIAGAVADWFKQAWSDVLAWFENAIAKIKEFFSDAWEGIKKVFSKSIIGDYFKAVWDIIKGVFSVVKAVLSGNWSDAWEGIKGIVSTWAGFFSGVWTKIKGVFSKIGTWFGEKFTAAKDSMLAVFLNIKAKFTEIKDRIFDAFGGIKDKFLEVGDNIVQGIWDGISGAYEWIKGKITGWVGNVTSFLKGLFGIESPSTVMRDEIGEMLPPGIAIGWEKAMPKMEKEMQGDLSALTAKMQATVATESAKVGYTYTGQIDGTEDIVRAVGMQTAGINSLANEYRRGSGNTRPVILKIGEREFGRAVVDLGGAEESRVGLSYA
jgi:phage-related protein